MTNIDPRGPADDAPAPDDAPALAADDAHPDGAACSCEHPTATLEAFDLAPLELELRVRCRTQTMTLRLEDDGVPSDAWVADPARAEDAERRALLDMLSHASAVVDAVLAGRVG